MNERNSKILNAAQKKRRNNYAKRPKKEQQDAKNKELNRSNTTT
ncbi:hypothetical protein HMPREF9500_01876 [Enterococcus faecalis TX0017]|nr:hypothetical protein HMPREF9500_01876 [Enterococcus faecalis TX0017]